MLARSIAACSNELTATGTRSNVREAGRLSFLPQPEGMRVPRKDFYGMSILHSRASIATRVYFDEERLHVCLSDGREISAPLSWFPRLQHATDD